MVYSALLFVSVRTLKLPFWVNGGWVVVVGGCDNNDCKTDLRWKEVSKLTTSSSIHHCPDLSLRQVHVLFGKISLQTMNHDR